MFSNRNNNINNYDSAGRQHGEWKYWHPNGQLWMQQSWLNGKKHGEWKGWYSNGTLESQSIWKHGKEHGEWKEWGPDGICVSHQNWKNGKKHGSCKSIWFINPREEYWFEGVRYPPKILPKLQRRIKRNIAKLKQRAVCV